uniref:Calcium channel flower n=1 Tax=Fibrocapsa japonica TaxID=94617 RepID=A0A7S2V3I2_9STRA|eukprot:CAMPEP_0113944176 /NCGR_PEP_ID=MMETSP1339-20121228/30749_1 /TAXON_ID=94617 /ORGANISM="Fibrocapsa japonica" /LENGTH=150 /DNA_ID=CAMNT_0000949263 /DNA_START=37 /DNA_END=489 /DNA_ORIENTATION=+ /assembly_acc=CAM_ASM_000762
MSFLEDLKYTAWDKLAETLGRFSFAICLVSAVLAFILGGAVWVGIYTLIIGILAAIVELPGLFFFSPNVQKLNKQLLDEFKLKNGYVRGTVYVTLSILMFVGTTICLLSGIYFLGTAAAFFMMEICAEKSTDPEDNSKTEPLASNSFGTF